MFRWRGLNGAGFGGVARPGARELPVNYPLTRADPRGKGRLCYIPFSHANWLYNTTFTGLKCWVLEDAHNRSGPMRCFQVSQSELDFWQALSRGVAYSTYEQLRD